MFTIQYMSDLHIELLKTIPTVIKSADYLALCGDIGNPYQQSYTFFLKNVSLQFKLVFVIAGNHEYYNNDIYNTNIKIKEICNNFPNVIFLNNTEYILKQGEESIRILGTTLWSNVTPNAFYMMNDSRKIKYSENKLTQNNVIDMHSESLKFIKDHLNDDTSTLILSHHAFSHKMNGLLEGNDIESAFSSDLEYLFRGNLVGVISGHTHQSMKIKINGIPCVENAYGYTPFERNKFNPTQVLTITLKREVLQKIPH
jgi:predicted phosphodiesterase